MNEEKNTPYFSPECHTMNVSIAIKCGNSDAGLIFNHIFFWIKNNKIKEANQIDGRTWMYETILHMQKFLPYLSEMQIKRALCSLVENGYLIKENYNKNKFDRTSWYALAEEEWMDFKIVSTKGQVRPIGESSTTQGEGEYDPSYKDKDRKDRYKKEEVEEENPPPPAFSKKDKQSKPQVIMIAFGDHVVLKDGEYQSLCSSLGKQIVDYYIKAINNWVPNNHAMKDYAAAIRSWHLRDEAKGSLPKPQNIQAVPEDLNAKIVQNRRVCEVAEAKLKSLFKSDIRFTTLVNKAELVDASKDVKKEYHFDKFDTKSLKETLIADLESSFKGAREILNK